MKKQIFIFVLALFFIGITKSYGQLAPRPVTCLTPDALHPIAGTPYSYNITVPTPAGTKSYTWFVTQDQHFINNGVLTGSREIVGTSTIVSTTGPGYNDSANSGSTVTITWQSIAYNPANPIFVVIEVRNVATIADLCDTKNMRVYKIEPSNAFTLDIANLNAGATPDVAGALVTGYGVNLDKCIHDIVDARYDAAAPEGVIYDYGVDYMFFEVVAANFNTSWKPSFTLTGADAEEVVTVEWATDKAFTTPHSLILATGIWASVDVYTTPAVGGAVGPTGESIYVRVKLDHSTTVNYEGLADEPVVLAVDGITNLSAPVAQQLGDVHTVAGGSPSTCPWVDGYVNDIANQTLKPRPTITPVAPTPFLPVKP
jgi:hypothetical protein